MYVESQYHLSPTPSTIQEPTQAQAPVQASTQDVYDTMEKDTLLKEFSEITRTIGIC